MIVLFQYNSWYNMLIGKNIVLKLLMYSGGLINPVLLMRVTDFFAEYHQQQILAYASIPIS